MKSIAERARAKRLRRKLAAGETLTGPERAFLSAYGPMPRTAPVVMPRHIEDAEIVPGSEVVEPRPPMTGPPDDGWKPIQTDAGKPAEPEKPHSESTAIVPKRCTIPDCPACAGRNRPGPIQCGTTGDMVWPPMSLNSGRMIAGILFLLFGFVIKIIHKLPEIPAPTDIERDELAKAIIDIVRRRAGPLGAWDDILAGGYALESYTRNSPKRAKKALQKGNDDGNGDT